MKGMSLMKKKIYILVLAAVLLISVLTLAGCVKKVLHYEFRQDISNITCAEIVNTINKGETPNVTESTEILHFLETDAAQALAEQICLLDGKYVAPPIHRIEGLTVIFYYTDSSYEMITHQSNLYVTEEKTRYDCIWFDAEEFEAVVQ